MSATKIQVRIRTRVDPEEARRIRQCIRAILELKFVREVVEVE